MLPIIGLIAGTALTWIGLIIACMGYATPYWLESSDGKAHIGLYLVCIEKECHMLHDVKFAWDFVKYFNLFGTLCAGCGCVTAVIALVLKFTSGDVSKHIRQLTYNTPISGSIIIIIGVIIFAAKFKEAKFDYGYSFLLNIVGSVLLLFGGMANGIWASRDSTAAPTLPF